MTIMCIVFVSYFACFIFKWLMYFMFVYITETNYIHLTNRTVEPDSIDFGWCVCVCHSMRNKNLKMMQTICKLNLNCIYALTLRLGKHGKYWMLAQFHFHFLEFSYIFWFFQRHVYNKRLKSNQFHLREKQKHFVFSGMTTQTANNLWAFLTLLKVFWQQLHLLNECFLPKFVHPWKCGKQKSTQNSSIYWNTKNVAAAIVTATAAAAVEPLACGIFMPSAKFKRKIASGIFVS